MYLAPRPATPLSSPDDRETGSEVPVLPEAALPPRELSMKFQRVTGLTCFVVAVGVAAIMPVEGVRGGDPIPGVTYPWTACRLTTTDCSTGPVPCFTPGQPCTYCLSGLKEMTCEGFALQPCKFVGDTPSACGNIWISYCTESGDCIPHQITSDTCPRVTCEVPPGEA